MVQTGPPAGGIPLLRTLRVGGSEAALGAQRPGGPACPAGVPISPEKWGERGPGLRPWTPGFMARSLSFARFGDRWLWYDSGAVSSGMLRPIWDAFSRENMLESIFAKESLQSLPLGGRTVRGTVRSGPGEATINHRWAGEAGSDEGAIWYPTFPCRKEVDGSRLNEVFLLPRWATRSPPHQSPSVTASPQVNSE